MLFRHVRLRLSKLGATRPAKPTRIDLRRFPACAVRRPLSTSSFQGIL
jgi:hypothetical protein